MRKLSPFPALVSVATFLICLALFIGINEITANAAVVIVVILLCCLALLANAMPDPEERGNE